ncbi:MAG: hypothetical protein ABSD71_08755 [Bacteroidales bacterium]|jgi:hypothetical protein
MEKVLFHVLVLIIISNFCLGQGNKSNSPQIFTAGPTRSCHGSYENKTIGICYQTTDTLTVNQLTGCLKLSVDNNNNKEITSFRIWYPASDTSMVEKSITGNQIPVEVIKTVIDLKVKKIMFDEVFGVEGKTNLNLGYRWFYLKS